MSINSLNVAGEGGYQLCRIWIRESRRWPKVSICNYCHFLCISITIVIFYTFVPMLMPGLQNLNQSIRAFLFSITCRWKYDRWRAKSEIAPQEIPLEHASGCHLRNFINGWKMYPNSSWSQFFFIRNIINTLHTGIVERNLSLLEWFD